ncbi:IS5 family transposase [Bradyrhizobium sp. AZCC 2262]
MRPRERRETGQADLLRSRLDAIIDMGHPLVKLAQTIDWSFLEQRFGAVYEDKPGRPPLPTRLMAGLAILKHTYDLSDEVLCERWVENPYYQFFCGEEFFQHRLVFDRSSLTRWRQRMGEEKLQALLQESLAVASKTEAIKPADLNRVIIDTTVQPKNVMFPTDARLLNRAREILVRLAKRYGVKLRQSYARVGKFALIKHQRYAHAKQFKRANRALKKLKIYLGRIIRDIGRKLGGNADLLGGVVLERMLARARQVLEQKQRQRGPKLYSLHAPEVECIGKGKAHRPYEFGVKVSVATTLAHAKGGQFVSHVKALPGNPYDGHTLATVIPEMEALIGNTIERALLDKGYRGHNAPPDYKFRVFISGQKRRVTPQIKRQLRRRSAVEPVIGHLKSEHRMGRNYLWHREGDAINAVLAAVGYNFRRLICWLRLLLWQIIATFPGSIQPENPGFFTADYLAPLCLAFIPRVDQLNNLFHIPKSVRHTGRHVSYLPGLNTWQAIPLASYGCGRSCRKAHYTALRLGGPFALTGGVIAPVSPKTRFSSSSAGRCRASAT